MAEPLSVRSRSARAGEESTARRQTGALHAAGLDYEGLLPEGGRQDHAGQHGSIVEGPSFEERSNSPLITDVSRTPTTSFKIENPNLAEHPVDDSGGETRRRDGPVIGESASVDAPRKSFRAEAGAGPDHAVDAPRKPLRAESSASTPTTFPIPTIEAPMRALIGRILQEDHQQQGRGDGATGDAPRRNYNKNRDELESTIITKIMSLPWLSDGDIDSVITALLRQPDRRFASTAHETVNIIKKAALIERDTTMMLESVRMRKLIAKLPPPDRSPTYYPLSGSGADGGGDDISMTARNGDLANHVGVQV